MTRRSVWRRGIMTGTYSLTIKTPQGESVFEGDRWEILSYLISGEIARLVAAEINANPGNDLEVVARKVLKVFKAYYRHRKRLHRSRISAVSLELELVKCYLRGLTINETVKSLKAKKNFRVSMSAIGRYWEVLSRIGITPVGDFTTD
jgi:hypothetical protein